MCVQASDIAIDMLRVGDVPMRAVQGAIDARGSVKAMIRPERVRIEDQGTTGENRLPGLVERTSSSVEAHHALASTSI